jgi:hypothetical protein
MARNKRNGQEPEHQEGRPNASRRPLPPEPDNWRSMINSDYEYPEELDDLNRRERRQAKKTWRRDDHAARIAWLRNQRQAEPVSPVAIVVLVAIVMIVILGLGGGLPKILGGDDSADKKPVGLLTPGGSVVLPTAPASSSSATQVPVGGPSTALTTPPAETSRPGAEVTARASDVVNAWAREFYTRDPAVETYAALVAKCAKYMTPEVAASFTAAGDSTYEALQKDGGKSTVLAAPVGSPMANAAPVDTLNRITRLVKVTINVTGKGAQRFDVPLLVTVVSENGQWLISSVSGGTGP